MIKLSTRQAAKKLGIDHSTLAKYLVGGKLAPPETVTVGKRIVHMWTEEEIERVRKLLPKIANGRKTRYKKKQSAIGTQPAAKTRRAQAGVPTVQKQKKKK
jgi:predicted site-specific integrase-resolvase